MLSFYVKFVQADRQTDRQTDGLTDRWTTVQQHAPDLSIRGHKKYLICFGYPAKII